MSASEPTTLAPDGWDPEALDTDEMILQTTMMGTDEMVRNRMRVWRDAGITTLRVYPSGHTLEERLSTLGRAIDMVENLNREQG